MRRAAMAAAALVLVGCSGGGTPAPTTVPHTNAPVVTTPAAPATTVPVGDVLAALSAGDSAALPQLAAAVAPGSPADRYVRYLTVARRLTGAAACTTACPAYSTPEHDPASGLLAGFSVDGVALAGRVTGAGSTVPTGDLTVRVAGAYRTAAGDVYAVLEAANAGSSAVDLFGFAAVYQPARSARAIDASAWWGAAAVPPGSTAELLIQFAGAATLGGTLELTGVDADGIDVVVRVAVPGP